jgi:phosphate transport system permease protein
MLAVGRAGGETAPLLFTSLGSQYLSTDILAPIASLPQLIFTNVVNTQTAASVRLAWGAALVLVAIVLGLNLLARLAARRLGPRRAR